MVIPIKHDRCQQSSAYIVLKTPVVPVGPFEGFGWLVFLVNTIINFFFDSLDVIASSTISTFLELQSKTSQQTMGNIYKGQLTSPRKVVTSRAVFSTMTVIRYGTNWRNIGYALYVRSRL